MRPLSLIALAAVASMGMAQHFKGQKMDFVPMSRINFAEKTGVQEFTGQMLARPLQNSAWKRMGQTDSGAIANRQAAENKIADLIVGHIEQIDVFIIRIPQNMDENMMARDLMKTGLYEYVEPNYMAYPTFTPNDALLGTQWSHSNSSATEAWDICRGNNGIIITLTDTGIHVTHQDITGANRVSGANSAVASNTSNVKLESNLGIAIVKDLHGHGTHVTGIAAANSNNGVGIAGVNIDGTRHRMVRVSDSSGGGSTLAALSIAALWASENGSRVASTSYSSVQQSIMGTTGTTCKNNGMVWCYAAGNDGGTYGASVDWPNVTIVGAIASNNAIASFSARGEFIDVMAGGVAVNSSVWLSDGNISSYVSWDGTSMACPYAAGIAAMLFSQNPNYTAQRVEDLLYKTSINNGASGTQGWGRVNLWNAMGRKANSMLIGPGFLVSGVLADLYRIEGNELVVRPGIVPNISIPPIQVETVHNVPAYVGNNFGEIDIMTKARLIGATGSVGQRLMIFNNATSTFETVATGPVNGNFFEGVFPVNAGNFANYIVGGTVKIKVQAYLTGPISSSGWRVGFDQINVRTLRATQ